MTALSRLPAWMAFRRNRGTDIPAFREAFVGPFRHLRGRVTVAPEGISASESLAGLLAAPTLDSVLAFYAVGFGAADPRPVASLWSQYAFGHLVVPQVAVSLLARRALPTDAGGLALVHDGGRPAGLRLPAAGRPLPPDQWGSHLDSAIDGQVAPLIDCLVAQTGAAPKMLWGNAATVLGWAIDQAAGLTPAQADVAALRDRLLAAPFRADGQPNPLAGALLPASEADGGCRRRVCCLRYLLPEVGGCGAVCPQERR